MIILSKSEQLALREQVRNEPKPNQERTNAENLKWALSIPQSVIDATGSRPMVLRG